MIDWLIVGGGVHGTVIAHSLLQYAEVARDRLVVVDPHERPLARWHTYTHACGMRFLRSPAAHAIIPDFTALVGWANRNGYRRDDHTIAPYARPSLELFNAHARAMIDRSGIASRWRRGTVASMKRAVAHWDVEITDPDGGSTLLSARNVVLGVGRSDAPYAPDWARADERIVHVFDDRFSRDDALAARRPIVVGGGVSAVHLAILLAHGDHATPTLIARHPLRVRQFDSDPCYLGPSCMRAYVNEENPARRREILRSVRNPGSTPSELAREAGRLVREGALRIVIDEIEEARSGTDVTLIGRAAAYPADRVIVATGFIPGPAGGGLVQRLAHGDATGSPLPVDPAGYPLPASSLEWYDGLYVTGALAEQELGPSAPNIIGAHNSAKRIIAHHLGAERRIPRAWRRYAPASVSRSSASS